MFDLGSFLKKKRKEKNLTLKELGSRINVSAPYISMLENGKQKYPSITTLKKIGAVLGLSKEELATVIQHITDDEYAPEETEKDYNLFVFDLEGLDEEDINHIRKQIELLKLQAKYTDEEN